MGACALAVWELALTVGYAAGLWLWCWVQSMGFAYGWMGSRMSVCALAVWEYDYTVDAGLMSVHNIFW